MEISPAADSTFDHGDSGRFTGEVSLRGTHRAGDGTSIAIVHFAAGARTHWHHHEGGQFLHALTGRGRVRSRGEAGHVLEPGDVISVEPNEWHFHGGTPDSPLVHVAVNGGGDAIWGEPVTDEDYAEGF
jgi:quercetin dioxygenase-like cupin family protein